MLHCGPNSDLALLCPLFRTWTLAGLEGIKSTSRFNISSDRGCALGAGVAGIAGAATSAFCEIFFGDERAEGDDEAVVDEDTFDEVEEKELDEVDLDEDPDDVTSDEDVKV